MDSDSETSGDEGFLSTLGSTRGEIQTEADEMKKNFDDIKSEQKVIEEKRLDLLLYSFP